MTCDQLLFSCACSLNTNYLGTSGTKNFLWDMTLNQLKFKGKWTTLTYVVIWSGTTPSGLFSWNAFSVNVLHTAPFSSFHYCTPHFSVSVCRSYSPYPVALLYFLLCCQDVCTKRLRYFRCILDKWTISLFILRIVMLVLCRLRCRQICPIFYFFYLLLFF